METLQNASNNTTNEISKIESNLIQLEGIKSTEIVKIDTLTKKQKIYIKGLELYKSFDQNKLDSIQNKFNTVYGLMEYTKKLNKELKKEGKFVYPTISVFSCITELGEVFNIKLSKKNLLMINDKFINGTIDILPLLPNE